MYVAEIGSSGMELSLTPLQERSVTFSWCVFVRILDEQLFPVLPTATLSMP